MSIEKSLERIADALEKFVPTVTVTGMDPSVTTGDVTVEQPAPKKKAPKKKAAKKKEEPAPVEGDYIPENPHTEDELRKVFQDFVGRKGSEEGTAMLKELIQEYGAEKIGDIKSEDYGDIINTVKGWK